MGNVCLPSQSEVKVEGNERLSSKQIDSFVAAERLKSKRCKKLLLLGAGESGKSTIYRQMKRIYGNGFNESELSHFLHSIRSNVMSSMQVLLTAADSLKGSYEPKCCSSLDADARIILDIDLQNPLLYTHDIASAIDRLWSDEGIQAVFQLRSQFQIPDSAPFFFRKAVALASPEYSIHPDDISFLRVPTTGILDTQFKIEGTEFRIYDVGGQRNERKKWIHCFENVTALIFVVAVSEYNQVMFEDECTNRMEDSLDLFEDLINSTWFSNTPAVLFLNKVDVLEEKITRAPISDFFPDYEGGTDVDAACSFFKERFLARNHCSDRCIYTHNTNATDSDNVIRVFKAVRDIVLRSAMASSGIL